MCLSKLQTGNHNVNLLFTHAQETLGNALTNRRGHQPTTDDSLTTIIYHVFLAFFLLYLWRSFYHSFFPCSFPYNFSFYFFRKTHTTHRHTLRLAPARSSRDHHTHTGISYNFRVYKKDSEFLGRSIQLFSQ